MYAEDSYLNAMIIGGGSSANYMNTNVLRLSQSIHIHWKDELESFQTVYDTPILQVYHIPSESSSSTFL